MTTNIYQKEYMKSNLKLVSSSSQSVTFDGTSVHIHDLIIGNQEIVDYMTGKEDPTEAFLDLIESALINRRISNSTAEAEKLGAEAERLAAAFDKASKEAVEEFDTLVKDHTDASKNGTLANLLNKKVLAAVVEELKPSNEQSPFHDISETLSKVLEEITKKVGAKEVIDNSSHKGTEFNLLMDGIVQEIAANFGDSALFVDGVPSETGDKVGDEVVTINSSFTGGQELDFVWEFKAEKGITQNDAKKELQDAMDNRHAVAGVFAVAREPKNAKWHDFSIHPGNRMIIVLDKDNPDRYLIKFAYMWAQWSALKTLEKQSDSINLDQIENLLHDAKMHMKEFAQIKKSHTGIQTSLDEAVKWTKSAEQKLKDIFSDLEGSLQGDD